MKTAMKTAGHAVRKVPQPQGRGALYSGGVPGNRGGGRKPDWLKQACRRLVSSDTVLRAVREILADPDHPAFMSALRWASENGYGKPAQSVELRGSGESPVSVQVWQFGDRKIEF